MDRCSAGPSVFVRTRSCRAPGQPETAPAMARSATPRAAGTSAMTRIESLEAWICAALIWGAKVLSVATDEVKQMWGCSLMVKPQSSKLITRVRFPSSPPKKSDLIPRNQIAFSFAQIIAFPAIRPGIRRVARQEGMPTGPRKPVEFRETTCLFTILEREFCFPGNTCMVDPRRRRNPNFWLTGRLVETLEFCIDCFCTNRGVAQLG